MKNYTSTERNHPNPMAELVTKCAEDSTQSCCQGTKAAFERRIAELDKEIEAIRNETHPELKRRKAALDARKQKKLKATELHLQVGEVRAT